MFKYIPDAATLDDIAACNEDIYNVLMNEKLGRRAAAFEITSKGFTVTDKVVRTWREKFKPIWEGYKSIQAVSDTVSGTTVDSKSLLEKAIYTNNKSLSMNILKAPVSGDKRVIAFGDFQINKHDPELLEKAVAFVKDQQPDVICLTGDESDNTAVGQWARGMKDEFEVSLQGQIDETIEWLTKIREAAPKAKIHMAHSNHMHWITKAIETRLPGLATLKALTPESLYQLKDLDIQYQRKIFEFLPNFLLAHGHQWKLTSGSHRTKGIQEVMRTGCSILAGHVHQAALETTFIGYEGKGEQKVYVNAGCMMDFEKSMASNGGYNAGTSPNWSSGIVVITREAGRNFTELLLSQDKMFRYEGKLY